MFSIGSKELETTAFMLRVRGSEAIEHEVQGQLQELSAHLDRLSMFEQSEVETDTLHTHPPTLRPDHTQNADLADAIIQGSEGEEDRYIVIPSVL